jgi:hypothetical protein
MRTPPPPLSSFCPPSPFYHSPRSRAQAPFTPTRSFTSHSSRVSPDPEPLGSDLSPERTNRNSAEQSADARSEANYSDCATYVPARA